MKILILAVMVVGGCSPHKVTNNPAPPVEVKPEFESNGGQGKLPERWWVEFGDDQLNRLVELTLAQNFDIKAAWARFRQARVLINPAKLGFLPEINGSLSAERSKTIFPAGSMIFERKGNDFRGSLGASFELDVWKRLRNQLPERTLGAMAFRNDVSTLAISLSAETTETWFDLVALNAQREVLAKQLEVNKKYLELTEFRVKRGAEEASVVDIFQQKQQVLSTESRITQLDVVETQLREKLNVLVGGQLPQELEIPTALPEPPAIPTTGMPADLLTRRPDVVAAMQRVESADYGVAVAVANMLPRIDLRATGGLFSVQPEQFFDNTVWNLFAGLTAPIFNRGVLKAQVKRQKYMVQESLANYGKVLLNAMAEVEVNAKGLEVQQVYLEQVVEQNRLATATLEASRRRYEGGVTSYLVVLNSLQAAQMSDLAVIEAKRQYLSYYIQLCRSLGGGWPSEMQVPEPMRLSPLEKNDVN